MLARILLGLWLAALAAHPALAGYCNAAIPCATSLHAPGAIGDTTPGSGTFTAVAAGAGSSIGWSGQTLMTSPLDGRLLISNNGVTDFGRLMFGGSSSAFPALKRSGTTLAVRLADDSADAPLTAAAGTFTALTGTSGTLAGLTGLAIRDTSAAFDVTIAATSSSAILSAGRTLTLNMQNVAHTLALSATANTITFPNTASYTLIGSLDTATVTNTMLAGSIAASKLTGTDITTVGALAAGSIASGFGAIATANPISTTNATASTTTGTGAVIVTGGVGIGGALNVGTTAKVTGITTPTGGVATAGGFAASCRTVHAGGIPGNPATSAFSVQTPVATEVYVAEVFIPANCTVTGVAVYNSATISGNFKVGLIASGGSVLATSASTAMSGTSVFQRVPFTGTYAAVGPAVYYIATFYDNAVARPWAHTAGSFGAGKQTGQTYATGFTSIALPTTFTTALGPVASLY